MSAIPIDLYQTQYDFLNSTDAYTGFIAGIGSGKTYVGSLKAGMKAQPGTLGMICAPTYGMMRDSTLRTFRELMGGGVVDFKKGDMVAIMRGGGEILFRSADDPDKLRRSKPELGLELSEGGLTHPETWKIVIGRLRADGEFGECWTTSTPKGRRNWLYEQSSNMTIFKATTLDNPFTSQEWKDSLLKTYTGKFFTARSLRGFCLAFEGLVYDFDKSIHVKKRDVSEFVDYGFGVDEGYTNPTVILKIYNDFDGRYHVMEEWYKTGKLHSEIVAQAVKMDEGKRKMFKVDDAAAGLMAALRKAGLNARGGKGRVLDGIAYIQELLAVQGDGKPRLTVDPSCVNMINEFESYVWKEERDEPVKEFDHSLDALRYYANRKKISVGQSAAKIANYTR